MIHISPDVPTRGKLWAQAILYGVAVATLVLVIAAGIYLVRISAAGEKQRVLLVNQNTLLIQCNIPPGERVPPLKSVGPTDCFTRSKATSERRVSIVTDVSILAAACGSAYPGDVAATRKCVDLALDRLAVERAVAPR